ncbi:hypothetical protein O9G_006166, partial [Rozella allomycis CSF55]
KSGIDRKKSSILSGFQEGSINEEKTKPVSFVIGKICNQEIPLFLDVGATCSIVSEKLLRALGVGFTRENAGAIRPVDGPPVAVLGTATLLIAFYDDVVIPVKFKVLGKCTVPILIGIDVCQGLRSKIDYEKEIWTFIYEEKNVALQLYARDAMIPVSEIVDSDSELEEAGETSDRDSEISEEDDANLCLFVKKCEMADAGLIGSVEDECEDIESSTEKPDRFSEMVKGIEALDEWQKKEVENLLREYEDLFPTKHIQMPGIKGSLYHLEVFPEGERSYQERD